MPASVPIVSGVSFVLPVRNGALWLDEVLAAIRAQRWAGPLEIIAVDDASTDASREVLERHRTQGHLTVLQGNGNGAAAAINLGVRAAAHPFVAQVDQDVVLHADWLERLMAALDDDGVAAAQGRYTAAPGAGLWSRVMALDLTMRYRCLGHRTDHVCTGNVVYRRSAVLAVGLFDEQLGYGYDNDMSYRLADAGYALAFCTDATSTHYWREGLRGYARQQYGFGYGRLDLVRKYRHRATGDDVSGVWMMLQGPLTACALALAGGAAALSATGSSAALPAAASGVLAVSLTLERLAVGLAAAVRFRDSAGLGFVPAHAIRNLVWVAAMTVWSARRLTRRGRRPADSMRPRPMMGAPCGS